MVFVVRNKVKKKMNYGTEPTTKYNHVCLDEVRKVVHVPEDDISVWFEVNWSPEIYL